MDYVAYYRVSTSRQGQSGLGLEAQQDMVRKLVKLKEGTIVAEFQEVESGGNNNRKELAKALEYCEKNKTTLVVAKLDRLARDAEFLLKLSNSGIPILFGDFPDLDGTTSVGRMVLTQMAAVAEFERRRISERIKAAMAQAKLRGIKLGGDHGAVITPEVRAAAIAKRQDIANEKAIEVLKRVQELDPNQELSRTKLAEKLNEHQIPTPRGIGQWKTTTITRLLQRVEAIHEQQRNVATKSVRSISARLQKQSRTVC